MNTLHVTFMKGYVVVCGNNIAEFRSMKYTAMNEIISIPTPTKNVTICKGTTHILCMIITSNYCNYWLVCCCQLAYQKWWCIRWVNVNVKLICECDFILMTADSCNCTNSNIYSLLFWIVALLFWTQQHTAVSFRCVPVTLLNFLPVYLMLQFLHLYQVYESTIVRNE